MKENEQTERKNETADVSPNISIAILMHMV